MVPAPQIVIIGTGFAGIGMAIKLKRAGIDDFVILERAADVGGVWRDNTYPGCACDVESHVYSFSFAPHPSWSRMFAPQAEIRDYLRRCADDFGVRGHIRFEHELLDATWDARAAVWRLETSKGAMQARILVSGMGALAEPASPDVPGLARFQGETFHSARWNHAYDLTGRAVAVIGTGASAIQFVPQIQPKVGRLTVFQRTPPWILPRMDRALTDKERARCEKLPLFQKLWRLRLYLTREVYGWSFRHPWLMKKAKQISLRHLGKAVKDPALRAKLTPQYEMGCKRILIANDYYPALTKSNVQVVTENIAEIRAKSVVTADGNEYPVDAIIFGTGFQVTTLPSTLRIHNEHGVSLRSALGPSPKAHIGTTVPGFPNFFMIQGPNTGLGHNSVVAIIEAQIALIFSAIRYLRRKPGAALSPTPLALERFIALVDAKTRGSVWTAGGCSSWYLDATRRNSTLWPRSIAAFRRVARFSARDYDISEGGANG